MDRSHDVIVIAVQVEARLHRLNLMFEQVEGIRVRVFEPSTHIRWKFLIWLAHLIFAMCVRTVLAKVALLLLLEVLADLCLIVIVRNVQHLVLDL